MNVKIISQNVLHISSFLDVNTINALITHMQTLTFTKKESPVYICSVYSIYDYNDSRFASFIKGTHILLKFVNTLFKKTYKLNTVGEIIKMGKGDFLATHKDDYNKLQAVLYLTDIASIQGGEFIIRGETILPKKGDVVIFSGDIEHSVNRIESDDLRYSISFGFV